MALLVDIRKRFHNFTLDVSFSLPDGVSGLLGASGSGKSLTLKCIAGIMTPDAGRIVLNDRVLFDSEQKIHIPVQKRNVGYLFQNYALFPNMTVLQNIRAGVRSGEAAHRLTEYTRVETLLEDFQLQELQDKYPGQLSGGQQQRVALARMLAGSPDILLLDEPFSALDSNLKWTVAQKLSDTLVQFGGTTLLVSHNKEEVQYFCDSVCVLDRGVSQPIQSVESLFYRPQTMAVCRLHTASLINQKRLGGMRQWNMPKQANHFI